MLADVICPISQRMIKSGLNVLRPSGISHISKNKYELRTRRPTLNNFLDKNSRSILGDGIITVGLIDNSVQT